MLYFLLSLHLLWCVWLGTWKINNDVMCALCAFSHSRSFTHSHAFTRANLWLFAISYHFNNFPWERKTHKYISTLVRSVGRTNEGTVCVSCPFIDAMDSEWASNHIGLVRLPLSLGICTLLTADRPRRLMWTVNSLSHTHTYPWYELSEDRDQSAFPIFTQHIGATKIIAFDR